MNSDKFIEFWNRVYYAAYSIHYFNLYGYASFFPSQKTDIHTTSNTMRNTHRNLLSKYSKTADLNEFT